MKEDSTIKQCTVILTRDCNLRCDFCYAKKGGYNATDRIDFEDLKEIVDFCKDSKVQFMVFTGGEPLLYPFLQAALQYIKKEDPAITVAIPTNGIMLEDPSFCKQLISDGVDYFDVSIKGVSPEEWYKSTGYEGFDKQLRAIQNLASMEVEFTCSMVITPENVLSFCDVIKSAYGNGAKQFSFTFNIDNSDSKDKGRAYLEKNDPFSLVKLFVTQIERLNAITDDWWIEYSFPMCVYSEEQLSLLEGRLASPCQIHLKNAVTFGTKKELLPCDMFIGQSTGQLGRDFSSCREYIEWTKCSTYQSTMEPIWKRPSDDCNSCKFLQSCYGGCPVLWKNYSYDELKEFQSNRYD